MSNNPNTTDSSTSCACGTGQTRSLIGCPVCGNPGMTVNLTTPQHTLSRDVRDRLSTGTSYHFCDNSDCDVVYYNDKDTSVFTTDDLKNRVTIKDDAPETPLCYCFKVLKKQALEEIARTGSTNVFQTIQAKMKPGQSCFCEKANPRGDTCTRDIQQWLENQGVQPTPAPSLSETGGCCGPAATSTGGGCCG